MNILEYLKSILNKIYDESLPDEVRIAIGLFILSTILLLSFMNIIIYFIILIIFDNKRIQEWMNKYKFIKYIFTTYKATRIYFLIFEISLSLYIIIFILHGSYKICSLYV